MATRIPYIKTYSISQEKRTTVKDERIVNALNVDVKDLLVSNNI